MFRKLRSVLSTITGAIDLASILTGVIVLGVAGGVISASVFGVIPFAQDAAAKENLNAVSLAQSVAQIETGHFVSTESLVADGFLPGGTDSILAGGVTGGFGMSSVIPAHTVATAGPGKIIMELGATATCYVAVIQSKSGNVFWLDESMTKAEPFGVGSASECAGVDLQAMGATEAPVETVMEFTARVWANTDYTLRVHGIHDEVVVNWGDGTPDEVVTSDYQTHTYASSGAVQVTVDGRFDGFGHSSPMVFADILDVTRWDGGTDVTDASHAFRGTQLEAVTFVPPSTITNMSHMFSRSWIESGSFAGWDTSNVTDMSSMFEGAWDFNLSVDSFDTSNVTDMSSMFATTVFNQPLTNFDTSNVTDMSYMFYDANDFNSALGSNFDTSNVTDMSSMFEYAENFDQSLESKFDTSNVTDMDSMFSYAENFNQSLGSRFDTSNVTDMTSMFAEAYSFNSSLGENFDTSSVTTMRTMFASARSFNQPLGGKFDTSNVALMQQMFYGATSYDQDLSGLRVSQFDVEPHSFSVGSALTPAHMPNWGN